MELVYHYVKYAAIYLIFGLTMGISSLEKFDPVPDWFSEQFAGTFIESFPGLPFTWLMAGVFEALVAIFMIISIVRLEFQPGQPRTFMRVGLAIAAFDFMALAIGQRITFQFDGAGSLFFYFGATMATLVLIHRDEAAESESVSTPSGASTA